MGRNNCRQKQSSCKIQKGSRRTAIFGYIEAFDGSRECALSGANASVAGSLLPWHTKTLKSRVEVGPTGSRRLRSTRKGAAIPGPSMMSLYLFKRPNPAAVDIHDFSSSLDCLPSSDFRYFSPLSFTVTIGCKPSIQTWHSRHSDHLLPGDRGKKRSNQQE
jgi:hypothetical protein